MKPPKWNKLIALAKVAALLVCGVLLIVFHTTSAEVLTLVAAIAAMAVGAVQIALFFLPTRQKRLDQGLLLLCAGLFILLRPLMVNTLQPYLLAFVVLGVGGDLCQSGLLALREKAVCARWRLIAGAVVFVYGLLLLAAPFPELPLHYLFIGVGYVLAGLAYIAVWILRMRKKPAAEQQAEA